MKSVVLATALLLSTPAFAQADATPKAGAMLVDGAGKRLGRIDRVLADGSLRLIVGDRFVTIPANTVTTKDGVVATSLTRREAARL